MYIINPDNEKKIDYSGVGFVAWKDKDRYQIYILKHGTRNETFQLCSDNLFKIYCKNVDFEKAGYNLNDVRFWEANNWLDKFVE